MFAGIVTPEHFMGEGPLPPRICGTEAEYDIQLPGEKAPRANGSGAVHKDRIILDSRKLAAIKIAERAQGPVHWLQNGGNLHTDCGRIEYSSFEASGPASLAAGDFAGMEIVADLCAETPSATLYRHAGNTVGNKGSTLGHHESFMTTRRAAEDERLPHLRDTYLTTRVWAWAGAIGVNGLELSQKAAGIGAPTLNNHGARTTEGKKLMCWVKLTDNDVFSAPAANRPSPYVRIEDRVVDGLFSRWAKWMSGAVGSLILRFSELKHVFDKGDHPYDTLLLAPNTAVKVLRDTSKDLTFSKTHTTAEGKLMTSIDIQEKIADYGDILRQRVELSKDEYAAVDELYKIRDLLCQTNIPKGNLEPIAGYIDFAPRIAFLTKYFPLAELTSKNGDVEKRNRSWNRVEPVGPGYAYWEKIYSKNRSNAPDPVGNDLIDFHIEHPDPNTRSAIKGLLVTDPELSNATRRIGWHQVELWDKNRIFELDPYQCDITTVRAPAVRERFSL